MPTCDQCGQQFASRYERSRHLAIDHRRAELMAAVEGGEADGVTAAMPDESGTSPDVVPSTHLSRGAAIAGLGAALAMPSDSAEGGTEDDGISRRRMMQAAAVGGTGALVAVPSLSRAQSHIEIADWDELANIGDPGETDYPLDGDYVLVADLDENTAGYGDHASATANGGDGWAPIGDDVDPFTGTFDGDGHSIADLVIDRPTESFVGVFGVVEEAAFTNLAVQGDVEAEDSVGGLVGVAAGGSFIDIRTDVRLISHNSGSGGLIGWTDNAEAGPLVIEDCSVSGDIDDLACCTGGVTGWLDDGSTVRNTHVHGDVFSDGCCSGGLFGWTEGSTVIEGCSMSGDVTDGCCLTGGIAGWFGVDTEVRDTVARGDVECGHIYQGCCSGGVTWAAFGNSIIENTHATGDVFDHWGLAGGFIAEVVDDVEITDSSARGSVTVDGTNGTAGGFAGAIWSGTVTDSVAAGDVSSNGEDGPVGGFVGYLDTDGHAERTAAGGNVDSADNLVGGHAGVIYTTVRQSLATGNVASSGDTVGGFAGLVTETGTVEQAYAWGDAIGADLVGGFAGVHDGDTVDEVYSVGTPSATDGPTVGGLVGFADGTVSDSYWDEEASGTSVSDGGTPLSTEQMTDADAIDHMVGFDFDATWRTREDDYPVFGWQGLVADEECIPRRHASRATPEDLICPGDRVLSRSDVDARGRRSRPTGDRRDRSRDDT